MFQSLTVLMLDSSVLIMVVYIYYANYCIATVVYAYLIVVILCIMPSPPTKSLDFRGFDSSRLLILRGGNSHVR